jgi:hypothetical protein
MDLWTKTETDRFTKWETDGFYIKEYAANPGEFNVFKLDRQHNEFVFDVALNDISKARFHVEYQLIMWA